MKLTTCTAVFIPLLTLFITCFPERLEAQCPQIEAIMIDACGNEPNNEFVIIHSGGGFNTSDIELDFDANNNIIGPNNNDININNGNWPANPTPCGLTTGSPAAFSGCSNLIAVGPGVDIPANSIVVLQTSLGASASTYDFSSLCGSGQCVYVISSSCSRSAGAFTNGPAAGTRTTNFSIAGGCNQSITYDLASAGSGNGTYFLPLSGTYGNGGCTAPPIPSAAPFPPNINPIANVSICGTYTLPAITGTNLTPNAAYFTGPNGTGTQYNPGDEISVTTTLYAFDQRGPTGCSDQEQFMITILPAPSANQPPDPVACAGQVVNVPLTGTPGATFPWTNDNPAIGLPASGTGTINFPAAMVGNQETATITVTPTQGSCTGAPVTFTITINPAPVMDDPANLTVCGSDPVEVLFTGTGASPTYAWTNSNPAIGLPANGSGDINFQAANVATAQVATIVVTPTDNGCTGLPQTFTITVNPLPVANQPADVNTCDGQAVNINLSGSAGATFSWTNDNPAIGLPASGSGNIGFNATSTGSPETATITVTPTNNNGTCDGLPVTFTITVNPGPTMDTPSDQSACAGDAISVVFTSTANPSYTWTNSNTGIGLPVGGSGNINYTTPNVATPQTATITVTPTQAGCIGTPETFTIEVLPLPVVSKPADIIACGGDPVVVNFNGTPGAIFDWTNDNPAIGLSASGTGNITFTASFSPGPETATLTVTPNENGCPGQPKTFTITINPAPMVDQPGNVNMCAGKSAVLNFSGTAGATLNWTNSNTAIGLPASGSGNISLTAANVSTPQTGTITITPTDGNCDGPPVSFTITVNPIPVVNQPADIEACNGNPVSVSFSGTPGASFTWANNNPAIGLPASGTGNISFTAANLATPQTAQITVTPKAGACPGTPAVFQITVGPGTSVNNPGDQAYCMGDSATIAFTGTGNPTFIWTNDNPLIGLPASGTGDIGFTAANVATPQTATITVTPQAAGGFAYVPNNTTNDVSVIDMSTNTVVATIPVSNSPYGVSVSPDGSKIFVSHTNGVVTVIDAATNTVLTTIAVASSSEGLVVSPDGSRVYVTGGNSVLVIDAMTNTVLTSVPVPFVPTGVTTNAAGSRVYVTGANSVLVIDAATNAVIATIPVPSGTSGLGILPNGNFMYVAATISDNIAVIDLATNTVVATIPAGDAPYGIAISPDGTRVYVTNQNSGTVSVIDPATNTVIATIPVGSIALAGPLGISVTSDGKFVYVANILEDIVSVIDATTNMEIAQIPAGISPIAFGNFITPGGNCTGSPQTFTITVSPAPTLEQPAPVQACGRDVAGIAFNASPGATVNWTNNNPAIGLPASGNGNISFTAANVAMAQTATITATPVVGSCSGTPVTVTVTINPAATGNISGDLSLCAGESATLTAAGGTQYQWNTGENTPAISVNPAVSTTYSVVVTNSSGCADTVSALVTVNPLPVVGISGNAALCAGESTVLSASGGSSYTWNNSAATPSISVNPPATTSYSVTATDAAGCTGTAEITVQVNQPDVTNIPQLSCNPADTGTVVQMLQNRFGCDSIVTTVTLLAPADTTQLTAFTCDPNGAGTISQNLSNQFGCDSVLITTILFDPAAIDTTLLLLSTCDPTQAGIVEILLTGADGCDSLVITNTTLLPADTTFLSATTCDPTQAGISQNLLSNADGCDSLIITNTTLLPADTTFLSATTCDPAQAGISQNLLSNADGCDSLVITNTTLLPADTTFLNATTCDPAQAGISQNLLSNANGCDSLVVTNTTLLPADTTFLNATTCDPTQAGISQNLLSNADGCDSLVVTNTTLLPADTTFLSATTCDPALAGISQNLLSNVNGCDSLVVTNTTLLPADTTFLSATTCDPALAGISQNLLSNANGCDSLVVTNTTLLPADTTFLSATTCDPTQAGISQNLLSNANGCDSLVVTNTALLPTDTTFLSATTCDPAQTGTFTDVLQNQSGCDSVLITTVLIDPIACAPAIEISGTNPDCAGSATGSLTIRMLGGQVPLQYSWSNNLGNTGTGQINDLAFPTTINNLPAGMYSITVTDLNTQLSATATVNLAAPPVLQVSATASLAYNGYAVRCANSSDGSFNATATGGTPPYQYAWSTGASGGTLNGLGAGSYALTVMDANGCTQQTTALLIAPPPLAFALSLAPADCGDTLIDATVTASGGVAPYTIALDGNILAGTMPAIGSGTHLIGVSDANGCSADSSIAVLLPPVPSISLPPDTSVVWGNPVHIEASTNLSSWASLVWQPLPDTACGDCLVQEWIPLRSEQISVTIADSFGCTAQAFIRITVEKVIELYVPNVFSPNQDGQNDIWQVSAGPSVTEIQEVQVFDRWGNLQYSWNNPIAPNSWPGWDGTTRGDKAEVGVYVYYIKVKLTDGSTEVIKGDVTLVER